MPRIGDLAAHAAQQLQDQHVEKAIANPEEFVDQEDPLVAQTRKNIFSKLEFKWRPSDAKILDQIRVAVDAMFRELFDAPIEAIDDFYGLLRKPQVGPDGQVEHDVSGRVVWQKDSRGREIEDWGLITGQDIGKCLADLGRIRLELAPRINDLLLEAIFAKHASDDAFADAYGELVDDTIPARNAYAAKHSRQDKYFAYFRFALYSAANAFMDEIINFCWVLERQRQFKVDGSDRR